MGIFGIGSRKNKAGDKPAVRTVAADRLGFLSIHRTRADSTLRGNEAIYAAVSRIANTVASLPVHLYKDMQRQSDHPLDRIIGSSPNPNMNSFNFIQTMEIFRNTEGNAYALILRDGLGAPMQLDVLDPTCVRPVRHPDTREMWYFITMDDGTVKPLPASEIIAVKHMSGNGECAIRPIDVLKGTLDYDRQTKQAAVEQMSGVNQGIFLTVPNTGLNPDAKNRVIDDFLDAYERSGSRVVVLEGGLTATTFSQSPVNAQLLDVERIMRNRVATVYNIPPHLLGDYSDTSFATAEQQMQEFISLTILPIVTQWEQELERKLLLPQDRDDGYGFRFDFNNILRADTATRANAAQMGIRGGWMTPNEARAREGLAPVELGNTLMSSRDMITLDIAVNHPEMLLGVSADHAADGSGKEDAPNE